MRLRHYGYALDLVLLATTGFLLSRSPLVQHVSRSPGGVASALRSLAEGGAYPPTPASAGGALFADAASQRWLDYVLGDNLGALASADAPRFHALDAWLNELVLPRVLPAAARAALPHVLAIWARNCIAGWLLYFVVGGLWAAAIYGPARARFFGAGGGAPPWGDMVLQVQVSTQAMPLYSLMPTLGEWLIERGWTHAYLDWPQATPAGVGGYIAGIVAYVFLVVREAARGGSARGGSARGAWSSRSGSGGVGEEGARVAVGERTGRGPDAFLACLFLPATLAAPFACTLSLPATLSARSSHAHPPPTHAPSQEWGIYWVHRYLHENRFLYKLLHRVHHIYNNNLSPFAGLAFHPIDGMLQVRASEWGLGVWGAAAARPLSVRETCLLRASATALLPTPPTLASPHHRPRPTSSSFLRCPCTFGRTWGCSSSPPCGRPTSTTR